MNGRSSRAFLKYFAGHSKENRTHLHDEPRAKYAEVSEGNVTFGGTSIGWHKSQSSPVPAIILALVPV